MGRLFLDGIKGAGGPLVAPAQVYCYCFHARVSLGCGEVHWRTFFGKTPFVWSTICVVERAVRRIYSRRTALVGRKQMSATIFRRGGKTKLFGVLFASGEMRFVVRFAVGDAHMLHTRYILRKYMYIKKQKKLRALREVSGGGPLHVLAPELQSRYAPCGWDQVQVEEGDLSGMRWKDPNYLPRVLYRFAYYSLLLKRLIYLYISTKCPRDRRQERLYLGLGVMPQYVPGTYI